MSSITVQPDFQRRVVAPLDKLARRLKLYVLVQGLCHCIVLFVGCAAVTLILDRLLVLGVGPRAAMLLLMVGLLGRALYRRVLRPAALRIDVNDVAALVEHVDPGLRDQLLSAVAFATGAGTNPDFDSPAMIADLIEKTMSRFQIIPTGQVLRRDRHYRYLGLALLTIALSTTTIIARPQTVSVFVQRDLLLRDVSWPISARLVLDGFADGKLRWPIGDELTLVARALDKSPPGLSAEFQLDSGDSALRDMDQRGDNQFVLNYGPLAQSMRVRLLIRKWGVDESTQWYTIDAVRRPSIQRVAIRITPPAYSGLEPFSVSEGQASADVLRGNRRQRVSSCRLFL